MKQESSGYINEYWIQKHKGEIAWYLDNAYTEYFRLGRWFRFMLSKYPNWQALCNNRSIVDIGCGEAFNCLPMLNLLSNSSYHGYDYRFEQDQEEKIISALNYAALKNSTLFGFGLRTHEYPRVYWQEMRPLLDKVHLYYRKNQVDASQPEFWDFVAATADKPGLLVLRQPDVRCKVEPLDNYPKMFSNILNFMKTSLAENGFAPPLLITTSNPLSQQKIYELWQAATEQAGFILTNKEAADFAYHHPQLGLTLSLTTHDTQTFGLPDENRINDSVSIVVELINL